MDPGLNLALIMFGVVAIFVWWSVEKDHREMRVPCVCGHVKYRRGAGHVSWRDWDSDMGHQSEEHRKLPSYRKPGTCRECRCRCYIPVPAGNAFDRR